MIRKNDFIKSRFHNGAPHASRHHCAGMTLVELMLALMITAMIGMAVGGMMMTVGYGTTSAHNLRSLVVRHRTLTTRLNAAVRKSQQMLALNSTVLMLWTSDTNTDGAPNLSELQRIEFNSTAKTITLYTWPVPSVDTSYNMTDDFITLTASLKSASYCQSKVIAQGVTAWTLATDQADPQASQILCYRITLSVGTDSDILVCAVSPHSDAVLGGAGFGN